MTFSSDIAAADVYARCEFAFSLKNASALWDFYCSQFLDPKIRHFVIRIENLPHSLFIWKMSYYKLKWIYPPWRGLVQLYRESVWWSWMSDPELQISLNDAASDPSSSVSGRVRVWVSSDSEVIYILVDLNKKQSNSGVWLKTLLLTAARPVAYFFNI